jgi:hypothetical protein
MPRFTLLDECVEVVVLFRKVHTAARLDDRLSEVVRTSYESPSHAHKIPISDGLQQGDRASASLHRPSDIGLLRLFPIKAAGPE